MCEHNDATVSGQKGASEQCKRCETEAYYQECGLTPGMACEELNLGVDDLLRLVLEGDYEDHIPPDDQCWPAFFRWERIKELKADPRLLADFRTPHRPGLG